MNHSSQRLGPCEVCGGGGGRYRCPGCEMVTCSLPCSLRHKKERGCSGLRSKTSFVPVKSMTEYHLLSDYRLLEEVSRVTDACTRDKMKTSSRKEIPLPHPLQRLRKAVAERKSRLYFLPKHFARHKENTTFWDRKANKILWRLQLVFLHARKYSFPVTRCSEEVLLGEVLNKCLKEAMARAKGMRRHLEVYAKEMQDVQVLMQVEKVIGAQHKMYLLDTTKTLKENFEGKRIVEFPVFYVVLKGFHTADQLNDVGQEIKSKSKLSSLLLSNYAATDRLSSEEEEENDQHPMDNDDCDDSEDSLDDALDSLGTSGVKDILSSLYKQAETTGSS